MLKLISRLKYIIILVLILFIGSACENDDICLEPGTPRLIITFYDALNPEFKKPVENLSVESLEYGNIFSSSSTDSIAIPMPLDQSEFTYDFVADISQDPIITSSNPVLFGFEKSNVFVNRACGYKVVFNAFNMTSLANDQWIQSIEIVSNTITDEKQSHVKIYH